MAVIKLTNSTNITMRNVRIQGADVGIEASNSTINANGMSFHDVGQAWKIDGKSSADIRGSRVTVTSKKRASSNAASGWMPSKASALPILCSKCATVSPSQHHQFRGLYFNLWDNEEPCPLCGGQARLSEGAFRLAKETVEVLKGTQLTFGLLAALANARSEIMTSRNSEDDALARLKQSSPDAFKLIIRGVALGLSALTAIVLIFDLANGYHDFKTNYEVDPISIASDFVLDRILPYVGSFQSEKSMEKASPCGGNREGTSPSYCETVPETVSSDLSQNSDHQI